MSVGVNQDRIFIILNKEITFKEFYNSNYLIDKYSIKNWNVLLQFVYEKFTIHKYHRQQNFTR